jgi:hypothetical protein
VVGIVSPWKRGRWWCTQWLPLHSPFTVKRFLIMTNERYLKHIILLKREQQKCFLPIHTLEEPGKKK